MNDDHPKPFSGKVVLVTGSTRGIGRAAAVMFAERGAIPIVHGSKPSGDMDDALTDVRAYSQDAIAISCELSQSGEIGRMFDKIEQTYGRLDVLVNNAAYQKRDSVFHIDEEGWDRVFSVNLKAPFLCSRRGAALMKRQGGGKIINIGSVHEVQPLRNLLPYSVSKSGLIMLTKCLALELAEYNIQVNQVAAGAVGTVRTDEERQEKIMDAIPAGRIAEPREIAALICYLASDEAAYVTGSSYTIDGGITLGFCASRPDL